MTVLRTQLTNEVGCPMPNPVNERLGRKRGDYAARAHRRKVRQVANQLARECGGFRNDLARSYLAIDPDDFEDAYTKGEHSHAAE